jgi:hypothetical protein
MHRVGKRSYRKSTRIYTILLWTFAALWALALVFILLFGKIVSTP